MTNEEYQDVQNIIVMLAGMVAQDHLDLPAFVACAEKADAIAPLLDPTLWMRGHSRLDAIRDLARAAASFQGAARKFHETMKAIEAKEKR